MQASANVANMEDTKVETDETAEIRLPDAEESLAMRKLLVSPCYLLVVSNFCSRYCQGVIGVVHVAHSRYT